MRNFLLALLCCFALFACNSGNKSIITGPLLTVDVTADYPKQNIDVHEIADVAYIPLESRDEFIISSSSYIAGTDKNGNIIIVSRQGDVFVFDPEGRAVRNFNRKGRGPQEYLEISKIAYNTSNDELYIYDSSIDKIQVYSSTGDFIRTMVLPEGTYFDAILPTEDNNLIGYVDRERDPYHYKILSFRDSTVIEDLDLTYEKYRRNYIAGTMKIDGGEGYLALNKLSNHPIMSYKGGIIICEASCDSIYYFDAAGKLTPIIARTPSITSMSPEIYLWMNIAADNYYFMTTRELPVSYNINAIYESLRNRTPTPVDMPQRYLIYDRGKQEIYEGFLIDSNMDNFEIKKKYLYAETKDDRTVVYYMFDAFGLAELRDDGKLSGKLAETFKNIDEEDNPVVMKITFRN